METNVAANSNYNFCELVRDMINGRFLIGSATFISLALILSGCDIKSNNFSMSIPSIFN